MQIFVNSTLPRYSEPDWQCNLLDVMLFHYDNRGFPEAHDGVQCYTSLSLTLFFWSLVIIWEKNFEN